MGLSVTQFSRTSNVATLTITGHPLGVGGTVEAQGIGSGIDGSAVITAITTNTVSFANTGANVGNTACAAIANGFDVLFSRQDGHAYPSPGMPSGFTLKQCLGSVVTDSSGNNLAFVQIGDEFLLAAMQSKTQTLSGTIGLVTLLNSPLGVKVVAHLDCFRVVAARLLPRWSNFRTRRL